MSSTSDQPVNVEVRGPNPWLVLLVVGALTAALGIWLIFSWEASLATIAILLAVGLFLNGLSELAWAGDRPKPWVGYLLGAMFVIGGIIVLIRPGTGLWALSLVIGISLIIIGVFQAAFTLVERDQLRHWAWILAFAVLTVAVGAAAIIWPEATIRVIGFLFGFRLLLIGLGTMAVGNDFRKLRA